MLIARFDKPPRLQVAQSAGTLGMVRFFYFCSLIRIGILVHQDPSPLGTLYHAVLFLLFLEAFLFVLKQPLLWTTLAVGAELARALTLTVSENEAAIWGLMWTPLLCLGILAGYRLQRLMKLHPALRDYGAQQAWVTFRLFFWIGVGFAALGGLSMMTPWRLW